MFQSVDSNEDGKKGNNRDLLDFTACSSSLEKENKHPVEL